MDHAGAHFLIISLPSIRMEFRKFGFFITKEGRQSSLTSFFICKFLKRIGILLDITFLTI